MRCQSYFLKFLKYKINPAYFPPSLDLTLRDTFRMKKQGVIQNEYKRSRQTDGSHEKAIKYYEQEGLITVSKNPDNGYREYSDQNVNTLKMIAALRMLALSVSDIKAFLLEAAVCMIYCASGIKSSAGRLKSLSRNGN